MSKQQQYPDLEKIKLKTRVEGLNNLKYGGILEKSFVSLLVGKPGSGKSTLIEQLLLNPDLYYKKFDFVFILSPSKFHNLQLDPNNCTNQFDIRWICQKLVDIKNMKIQKKFNILFVFDDMISQIKANENLPVLQDLFFNRRNMIDNCTISILVTSQKFNKCPTVIRNVTTSMFVFNVNPWEWELIRKEYMKIDSKELKELTLQVFQGDGCHDFLFIKSNPFKIYHNFKPIILKSDYYELQKQLYSNNQVEKKVELEYDDQKSEVTDVVQQKDYKVPQQNNYMLQKQIKEYKKQIEKMQFQIQNYQNQQMFKKNEQQDDDDNDEEQQVEVDDNYEYDSVSEKQQQQQQINKQVQRQKSLLEERNYSFEQYLNSNTSKVQQKQKEVVQQKVQQNQQNKIDIQSYF